MEILHATWKFWENWNMSAAFRFCMWRGKYYQKFPAAVKSSINMKLYMHLVKTCKKCQATHKNMKNFYTSSTRVSTNFHIFVLISRELFNSYFSSTIQKTFCEKSCNCSFCILGRANYLFFLELSRSFSASSAFFTFSLTLC